ncbi:MAG TPA: phosphatidate cytidylyltransferase [Pirellulales bacterium]
MLHHRLLVGSLLIGILVGLCWLDQTQALGATPGAWLFPLAVVLSVLASGEILALVTHEDRKPAAGIVYVGNLAIVGANVVPLFWPRFAEELAGGMFSWPLAALVIVMLIVFVVEMWRYKQPGQSIQNISAAILCLIYVGLLLTFVVQLSFGIRVNGLLQLLSLIIVVKMGDTGAYTMGRMIGRHKMTPRLSPAKTWEGFGGAMLFAVAGSWATFHWLAPRMGANSLAAMETWRWIAFGLIVGIAGLLGDLAESLLKRDAGQKNSSTWMPGLGGVLDVLDSILFAAPVAYLCWAGGLLG